MGIGSNKHSLVGVSLIFLRTSSSLMDTKTFKAGGAKFGTSVKSQK